MYTRKKYIHAVDLYIQLYLVSCIWIINIVIVICAGLIL